MCSSISYIILLFPQILNILYFILLSGDDLISSSMMTLNTICIWISVCLPVGISSLTSKQLYPISYPCWKLNACFLIFPRQLFPQSPFSVNNNLIFCFSAITLEVIPDFSLSIPLTFNPSPNHISCLCLPSLFGIWPLLIIFSVLQMEFNCLFFPSTPSGLFSIPKQEWAF